MVLQDTSEISSFSSSPFEEGSLFNYSLVCLASFLIGGAFFVEAQVRHRHPNQAGPDETFRAFIRWHFIFSVFMILYSIFLTNPHNSSPHTHGHGGLVNNIFFFKLNNF